MLIMKTSILLVFFKMNLGKFSKLTLGERKIVRKFMIILALAWKEKLPYWQEVLDSLGIEVKIPVTKETVDTFIGNCNKYLVKE